MGMLSSLFVTVMSVQDSEGFWSPVTHVQILTVTDQL